MEREISFEFDDEKQEDYEINTYVEKLIKEHPLLRNHRFLKEYEKITHVLEFLADTAQIHFNQGLEFKPFKEMKIKSLDELGNYLFMLRNGNLKAREYYKQIYEQVKYL